jgi:hypothetical protein
MKNLELSLVDTLFAIFIKESMFEENRFPPTKIKNKTIVLAIFK